MRPRIAVGVVGAFGRDWSYGMLGGGPGVGVELGVTLGDHVGLVMRGVFATVGIFSLVKAGAAVAFDLTERWSVGAGLSALVLGHLQGLASDLPAPSVGIALSLHAEYRIPLAPAAAENQHGITISLEVGPGITLRSGGCGYSAGGGTCRMGTPISIDGVVGVAYSWR